MGDSSEEYIRKASIVLAVVGFFLHVSIWAMHATGRITVTGEASELLGSPLAALYTPFSILLVYEAYLMIYYLRRSTTLYIAKQYEVIALILIRGLFKDMAVLDLGAFNWQTMHNLAFAVDILSVIAVFLMIFSFYKLSGTYKYADFEAMEEQEIGAQLKQFVKAKHYLSLGLFVIFIVLGLQSFIEWVIPTFQHIESANMIAVNDIFFEQFYNFLIVSDVLILLFSLLYTDNFPVIIRNSSFVISTVLLKLSFTGEGLLRQALIILGVGFGVLMLAIHNKYRNLQKEQ